ncbi:Uncharacterized protein PPKH_4267 [Pseudomonas putida]|nr:Uncharacterized protein PPKH_4267 [Pseudomonas putida]
MRGCYWFRHDNGRSCPRVVGEVLTVFARMGRYWRGGPCCRQARSHRNCVNLWEPVCWR